MTSTLAAPAGLLARAAVRPVRWRYHFTDFRTGRLLATLPMTGVQLSEVLSGAASGSGTVPLAEAVRTRDPFAATIPRRSCLWAERQVLDPATGRVATTDVPWAGLVMRRTRTLSDRSMKLGLVTWASYFQRRLGGDRWYTQQDKFRIMRELLAAAVQQPTVGGYSAVSPHHLPLTSVTGDLSGVRADRTYLASDLKPVLELGKELAASGDGFDWRLTPYMETPGDLSSFRLRLDLGYPRLGRVAPPDLRWSTEERDARQRWGYVSDLTISEDGSAVDNRVTALGEGTGPLQLRSVAEGWQVGRDEPAYGYPLYESSLQSSTADLRTQDALDGHAFGALLSGFASEMQVTGVKVRGDLPPTLDSYLVGDDATLRIGEGVTGQPATVVGQIIGRVIRPAEQGRTEQVDLDLQGAVTG